MPKHAMDGLEEPPSKVQKLSSPLDLHEPSQKLPASSPVTFSSPTKSSNLTGSKTQEINDSCRDTVSEQTEESETDAPVENDLNKITSPLPSSETPSLSKSQQKKLRKKAEWEAGKDDRRLKRRERHKEKQARKASIRSAISSGEIPAPPPPLARATPRPARPIQVPIGLILDCGFDEQYMTEKEIVSLSSQLTRCYSDNRTAIYRSHMAISEWGGALKKRFETVLSSNHMGWKGVRFIEEDFVAAAGALDGIMRGTEGGKLVGALAATDDEKEQNGAPSITKEVAIDESGEKKETEGGGQSEPKLLYLTADSDNTITRLLPNTSYIIGGIVDKNRHKGICYKRASALGIPTAKLPIGKYMTMQSRSVLAVNHVMEIMLKWLETGDWGEAFVSVIPKRKEAKLRKKDSLERGNADEHCYPEDQDGPERDENDNRNHEKTTNVGLGGILNVQKYDATMEVEDAGTRSVEGQL